MTRTAGSLALVLAGLLTVVGCPSRQPRSTSGEGGALPTLTVGYFPNVTHAPAVLGFSSPAPEFGKALASKASLRSKLFNAGPAAMKALGTKAVDLCFVGPAPAVDEFARTGDLVVVANVADGGSSLVARRQSGIAEVKDLAGRRIAVPQLGNTQDAMLRHVLRQAHIGLKGAGGETDILAVNTPDLLGLFKRGQVDAACVPEPWGSLLEVEADAVVILDWIHLWLNGSYPTTVLVARKDYLKDHRDVVKAFVDALSDIVQRLDEDAGAEASAVNAALKDLTGQALSPEVITRALSRLNFTTAPDPDALRAMGDLLVEVGYADTTPDLTGLVDTSLLGPAQ